MKRYPSFFYLYLDFLCKDAIFPFDILLLIKFKQVMENLLLVCIAIFLFGACIWIQLTLSHRVVRQEIAWSTLFMWNLLSFSGLLLFCKDNFESYRIFSLFGIANLIWPVCYYWYKRIFHIKEIKRLEISDDQTKQHKINIEEGKIYQFRRWLWRYYISLVGIFCVVAFLIFIMG